MSFIKESRIFTIIKLSRQAYGGYKWQIIALTILGFFSGILEGIGVNALIPLFSFFTEGGDQGSDPISKFLKSGFAYFNIDFSLKQILIFICLLFIFKAIVLIICSYINIKIATNYEEQTRSSLFNKTLKANWPYLLKQKLGYLETVLMTDVRYSALLLQQISLAITILTSLLIYIVIAINISFTITLATLALGGILFLFFKPLIYRTRIIAKKAEKLNKEISHLVNENIVGIKTIKTMFVADKVTKLGKKYFDMFKSYRIRITLLKDATGYFLQPISLIFICAVFAFSYKMSNFSLPALIAVIYLIHRIFQYFQQLQSSLHTVNEAFPYLKNVLNYQEEAIKNKEEGGGVNRFNFNKILEFKNINFSYNKDREILTDINFNIKKGEMVGLIGPSGAGKTTLVDLILRLLIPDSGKILLDKKSIADINTKEWRENIGYVSQDIFLMNDTIYNNIKFYNNSITREDVEKAVKMANIYSFIEKCPDKMDTVIGERGITLSGGERQRIVIARVLAKNPKFLIFDEATSALDNESEVKIQKVIENLKGKITVLAIAHRLSTVLNSDKLLVLKKGRITEQGDPNKLLKDKKSYFTKVYNIRK